MSRGGRIPDMTEELERLALLRDAGDISAEEFEVLKRKLIYGEQTADVGREPSA